ncbi:NAD(P)/FAD-dependent oxidoreductase [Paractinoplanes ferrugineus]|uniref:Pentachlorophenol monooxygenase n=1 Tax=Paractinoplanes ferrugineus TaxID=113564 RepID=A0A919MI40_9ACTN|nr:FAD-dependent monooxygenase [Actinoplanes ferrugineus]GIE13290.1 pentachlorophenol monooxygenase [Actinoplanes ferrugineus]
MRPSTTDVLVVGAGPVGLATAAALQGAGVDVIVVDRSATTAHTSRAAVVHARTLEVLERIGAARPLVAAGLPAPRFTIRDRDRVLAPITFGALPTPYPYALMVPQSTTEAILDDRLTAAGGRVARGHEAVGLSGATVTFATGEQIAARYVVAADGMNSTIRRLAGIGAGSPPATSSGGDSFALADVRVHGGPPRDEVVLYFSRAGLLVWAPLPDGTVRIVAAAADAPERAEPEYVQALLRDRGPVRIPARVTEVTWSSRFRVHHRVAETFRAGPVLLAGDAGHVHSPAGGQGMNLGIKDALALADALVDTLTSGSEEPLDRYAAERLVAARQVVGFAARLTRLATVPAPVRPIRNAVLSTLARVPAVRSGLAHRLSGVPG